MADQLYLSYWIDGFTEHTMLRYYEKALRLFPVSRLNGNASTLRITPIADTEPAVFEQAFAPGLFVRVTEQRLDVRIEILPSRLAQGRCQPADVEAADLLEDRGKEHERIVARGRAGG